MTDAHRRPGRLVRATLLAALAAVTGFALLPAAADAGRARISNSRVVFDAFPGEANDVKVAQVGRITVNVTDNGAPVTPGSGCVRVTDNLARCTARRFGGLVRLGDGDDRALSRIASLHGEDGNDTLTQVARRPSESPRPYGGNVAAGAAMVTGGAGNDTISANDANGGDGDDTLAVYHQSQAVLFGGPGDDEVRGSPAADVLAGGLGIDRIVTGGGSDELSFQDQTGPIVFSTQAGGSDPDVYEGSFAHVRGASPTDQLTGDDGDNLLVLGRDRRGDGGLLDGRGGNDSLTGAIGRDRLLGAAGNDALHDGDHGGGVSELDAGEGDDFLNVADVTDEDGVTPELEMAPTADVFTCGPGVDRVVFDVADVVPDDCEVRSLRTPTRATSTGTDGADTIEGFSGDGDADVIYGLGGDDLLSGRGGNDVVYGQDGNDNLVGDGDTVFPDANDRLSGGNGNDLVVGGGGRDALTGGAGADNLQAGAGDDAVNARDGRRDRVSCGPGRDRVTADRSDTVSRDCERVTRR